MRLGLNQSARLEQRLVQSPQMIQAMQILQLPALELWARIQQELVENPFLELAETEASEEEETEPPERAETAEEKAEEARLETMLEELERYERDFDDGSRRQISDEAADRKLEAMQNTPDVTKTLADELIEELAFLDLDDRRRALAVYLLYSLDERGYLAEPLEDIARACNGGVLEELPGEPAPPSDDGRPAREAVQPVEVAQPAFAAPAQAAEDGHAGEENGALQAPGAPPDLVGHPVSVEELQSILAELRTIAHPAIGARDLRECLLLQIDALELDAPLLRTIVEHHLEDVEQNRLPRIAKATGHSIADVKAALETLKTLDPNPGAGYGESRAAVITPEVLVEEIDGDYVVRLDRQRTPELTLSPAYRELLRKAQKGDGVREWVKKRLESARWFIDAVQQRQSTLQRIADAIFTRQRDFLDKGVRALKPLRMQEVADQVGVHISTVSRAASGKYAQTPRGIFPLKFFFTGGTTTTSGEVESQASIKQRLADLVAAEDPDHPLSDDQLAALLEERDSIKIARRTVTKYRKALAIPPSSQRRKF